MNCILVLSLVAASVLGIDFTREPVVAVLLN